MPRDETDHSSFREHFATCGIDEKKKKKWSCVLLDCEDVDIDEKTQAVSSESEESSGKDDLKKPDPGTLNNLLLVDRRGWSLSLNTENRNIFPDNPQHATVTGFGEGH